MTIEYLYNDGGRKDAGFKGKSGDCVTRSIAIATGLPYKQVYDRLAEGNASQRQTKGMLKTGKGVKTANHGIYTKRKWFKDYMAELGATWTPTMFVGQGCKVHLNASELPKGRIITKLSRHYAAVIDGVLHDTYDSSTRTTNYYSPNHPNIPKGAVYNEMGEAVYKPERCVYGYWTFNEDMGE